ncbi:hypothetical protein NLI96_g6341 [Meripilus lineatus]|uniref:Uncharacterized protein n=1 Tax=Meripilus lineatus TaxID=2056292 RepID=A0AAD5V184_9APHY|nr:hypothetical protein NLI96_g6341 [Physisporinus lineatus]
MSHFIFHLRQVFPSDDEDESRMTPLEFAPPSRRSSSKIIGNIGAPLHNMFREEMGNIQADSTRVFTNNPLAISIPKPRQPVCHDDDSDDESVETVETKLDLFFDDEDYGKKVLRFMKRGDTIDDTMGDFEEKVQLVTHPEGNGR